MKKRILIIVNSLPTKSFPRAGVFMEDEIKFYKKKGFEIKILVLNRIIFFRKYIFKPRVVLTKIKNKKRELKILSIEKDNIEIINYYSMIAPFNFREDLLIFKKSKWRFIDFTTVIVHFMQNTGFNIRWIRNQFSQSKIVLKVHSDWTVLSKIRKRNILTHAMLFDEIWANSKRTKHKFIKTFPVLTDKIKVDYPKFKINTNVISKRTTILNILTVANLIQLKGFDEMVDVVSLLKKNNIYFKWTIIGQGVYFDEIMKMAKEKNIINSIIIVDEVRKDKLYQFYINTNVYMQLSHRETFGVAPLEAFSFYNKLIVSDNIPAIKEFNLNTNRNVLILKKNIQEKEQALLDFIYQKPIEECFSRAIGNINSEIQKINE